MKMKKIEYQSSSGRTADIVGYEAFVKDICRTCSL
jgi:hypothetical protein